MVFLWTFPSLVVAENYVPGEVIVKHREGHFSLNRASVMGKAQVKRMLSKKRFFSSVGVSQYKIHSGFTVKEAVKAFAQDPSVEYAEPNYYVKHMSVNREKLSQEALLSLAKKQDELPLQAQGLRNGEPQRLSQQPFSSSLAPIIAVIDSGIDLKHSVFRETGALWVNSKEIPKNNIDDDGNGFVDDIHGWNFIANNGNVQDGYGHGTHVAGIILKSDAGISIMSSPYGKAQVKIMTLKFLSDKDGLGKVSDAIRAIDYAINNGARILNNSWGTYDSSRALKSAVERSYNRGVVFVAAAGNEGTDNDLNQMYPASYGFANVISVAATTQNDWLSDFSNFGKSSVDIGGLGSSVVSTFPGEIYASLSGTSMAAPFVSGLAGLLLSQNKKLDFKEVRRLVFEGSDLVSALSDKVATQGRLNSQRSIDNLFVQRGPSGELEEEEIEEGEDQETEEEDSVTSKDESILSDIGVESGGGCGMVQFGSALAGGATGKGALKSFSSLFYISIMLTLFLAPMLWLLYLSRFYHRRERSEELRKQKRYPVNINVGIQVGNEKAIGYIKDLSTVGVRLCTQVLLEKGKAVTVILGGGEEGFDKIKLKGKVVWCQAQKSYGVEFNDKNSCDLAKSFVLSKAF